MGVAKDEGYIFIIFNDFKKYIKFYPPEVIINNETLRKKINKDLFVSLHSTNKKVLNNLPF